jgi:hypothetical protein
VYQGQKKVHSMDKAKLIGYCFGDNTYQQLGVEGLQKLYEPTLFEKGLDHTLISGLCGP